MRETMQGLQNMAESIDRKLKILIEELDKWSEITNTKCSSLEVNKRALLEEAVSRLSEAIELPSSHIEWNWSRPIKRIAESSTPIYGPTTVTLKVVYDHTELETKRRKKR